MNKILAVLGVAVAVPVALAVPALAKSPDPGPYPPKASVYSVLQQHEGFRAEVTYLCTGPKHQEGVINVSLQQPPKPGASEVTTVASAHEEAKCDGKEREEKIKIPLAGGAVQIDQQVWLYTTLFVNGERVACHASPAEPVGGVRPEPTATPTPTESATPSPTPSSTPSPSPEAEGPSASPCPTATP